MSFLPCQKQLDRKSKPAILGQKLYDNPIQEIISDTPKLEKLNEASLQRLLSKLKKKENFLMKMYMINCILLVLILNVSMVLLKCTSFLLVIHFLNFIRLFHL